MPPSSSPPSTSPTAPSAPLQSSCVQTCSLCVLVWRLPLVLFSPSAPFVPVKSDGVRTRILSASARRGGYFQRQRAFCASEIRRRADAESIRLDVFTLSPPPV